MKRLFVSLGIVLVLLLAAFAALFGPAFLGMKSIPENFEVNGMRLIKDSFTTLWLVPVSSNEVALIDAAMAVAEASP